MLLDSYDLDYMFRKKCHCFGAAFTGTVLAAGAGATAANIALAGTIISTVGMISQGQSQASQAKFQAGMANRNATVAQQQADRAIKQSRIDAGEFSRGQSDLFGTFRAGRPEGAPLSVASDFAGDSEFNRKKILNQGFVTENRLLAEVQNQQSQGQLFQAQGKQAVRGSLFKAGGRLFKGGQDIYGYMQQK